jgi:hypothetical protein
MSASAIIALVVLPLGIMVVLAGLFADRSRGRLRCRECRYRMEGAPTLRCSECGRWSDLADLCAEILRGRGEDQGWKSVSTARVGSITGSWARNRLTSSKDNQRNSRLSHCEPGEGRGVEGSGRSRRRMMS